MSSTNIHNLYDSGNATELSKLRRENDELRREVDRLSVYRQMAYRDCLTGLHNRRYFEERIREECARAARTTGYCFSVVLIDVDDFKTVNDTLGHAVGDEVLEGVARFLRDGVREVDIVCRMGGDEFALLLPDTPAGGCQVVIERMRAALENSQKYFPTPVGLSLGGAAHPPGPADGEGILAQADTAMYMDKRQRKAARSA